MVDKARELEQADQTCRAKQNEEIDVSSYRKVHLLGLEK